MNYTTFIITAASIAFAKINNAEVFVLLL